MEPSSKVICDWEKVLRIVVTISFLIGIILLGWNNLRDPNFWLDEAWQFESSHGIALDAPPLTPIGSITDVIRQNQIHNGDPGGFTFILYFWTKLDTSPFWLRLVPYTFFLISVLFTAKFASFFIKSKNILAFMPFFLLLISFVFRYGFVLRPYSMELCGMSVILYLMMKFLLIGKNRDLWTLGIAGAFFLTSRYSFFLSFASIVMTIFILKYRLSLYTFLRKAYGLYIPPIIMAVFIYFFALRYQMADPFTLHAPYLLRGQTFTEGLKIFYVNFFSLLALPTTIFLILILILYREELCKISFIKKDNLRIIGSPFALFLWIVFLEIFFIISSYLGFIPWHINQRWSLGIQYASTISVIGLIGYMYIWLTTHIRKIVLSPYVILLLIFFYGIVLFTTCLKQGDSRDSLYSNLITRKEKIYTERYYINYRSLAMIRYLFEFGPFKSLPKEIYPNHFTFETKEEHDTSSAINLNKIDVVLISHDTPEDYISRFSSKLRDITIYKPSYMFEKLP